MISLHLSLANPWAKENFKNLWHTDGSITKNKHWELEFIRHAYSLIEVAATFTTRQDHAGLSISLALFGYTIALRIYDDRHWDDLNECWEIYKEEK